MTTRGTGSAQRADQDELIGLHGQVTSHTTNAADAGTRRDNLLAEQQPRAGMPEAQRSVEQRLRLHAAAQRIAKANADRQAQRSRHLDHDPHRSHQSTIDRGGPSPGL